MHEFILNLLQPAFVAGDAAMGVYSGEIAVDHKADNSPVTAADFEVDKILQAALAQLYPDIPVVSEERAASHEATATMDRCILIDPIDGTKEFIKKTGEFTINVALIEKDVPVAGLVYAPALERMFLGGHQGGAFEMTREGYRKPIGVRCCQKAKMTAVASRSHVTAETEAFLSDNQIADSVNAGSSLKFCLVAAGEADVYPRFGPTMEWDTAAGHAVLTAAGGLVLLEDGTPLRYGKDNYRNPYFIAGSPDAMQHCGLQQAASLPQKR